MVRKLFVSLSLATLAVGPLSAASMPLVSGAHVTAPAHPSALGHLGAIAGYVLGVTALGITIKKDTATVVNKWQTRASAASGDYKTGVQSAGGTWETNAGAAEQNWEQGTQDAVARKAFSKGVVGKGGKFQANAANLGASRYPQGVQNAQGAYQAGIQPVLDALKAINLPPKGPRRSPQNQQRAAVVATMLGKLKTGH